MLSREDVDRRWVAVAVGEGIAGVVVVAPELEGRLVWEEAALDSS
jgi:hypothetical protein